MQGWCCNSMVLSLFSNFILIYCFIEIIQSRLLFCLQFFSMSEKFWQYWILSWLERQRLKLSISTWQGFDWPCCCWVTCCCSAGWLCDEDPPINERTAWWATYEPAPKAIPCAIVLPIPDSMPPLFCCTWGWMGVWAGMGRVAVGVCLVEGLGDDDLPLDPPPLDLPPRPIYITNKFNISSGHE